MRESRIERRERERREEIRQERVRQKERNRVQERKRRRRRVGGVIALVVILLVAFTGIRIWMEMRPGAVTPIVIAGSGDFSEGRVNILFLGTNQGLSDTIIVFSLDSDNKRLDGISIPRDTYYHRSNYSGAAYQKINSVYSTEGYEGACRAASEILGGIPIHYYAELDTKGAARVVDAMGGVMMDVPIDMYYEDPDQGLYINLKAGPQLLNGDQAMQYARFRSSYANGDLGRVSAQQELIKAVIAQSAGLDYPRVAIAARAETKTNMNIISQAALASRAAGMTGGTFITHMIPGSPGMKDGLSYFFHDAEATRDLISQIYNG